MNDAEDLVETETPLTIVAPNRRSKFHYFFSKGTSPKKLCLPVHDSLHTCSELVLWESEPEVNATEVYCSSRFGKKQVNEV